MSYEDEKKKINKRFYIFIFNSRRKIIIACKKRKAEKFEFNIMFMRRKISNSGALKKID